MSTTEAAVMMEAFEKVMDRMEKLFAFAINAQLQEKQNERKFILEVFQSGVDSVTNNAPTSSHGIKTLEQDMVAVRDQLNRLGAKLDQARSDIADDVMNK